MRWGKSDEYWAREVGDGYVCGNWKTEEKYYIFPNNKRNMTKTELAGIRISQYENERLKILKARESQGRTKDF